MSVLGGLRRTVGLILRTLGGLWSFLMILLMAGSLALSVAMTMVPAIFVAVAGVVESATGLRSLSTRHMDDLARLERRAAAESAGRRTASARADDLARDLGSARATERRLAAELADSRAARARLARELADNPVSYRGGRVAARDAVKDTATRVSRRTAFATSRNLASMAGEALPVIGTGVIVAATAWELGDACAMMGEMRALDAAFNPDDPVTDDEICGLEVPTRADLWAGIKASPAAAWERARGLYDGLPDVSISATYSHSVSYLAGLMDGAFSDDSDPPPVAP